MEEFQLPEDFLMGTSVSAVFIEGGNSNTSWYKWCEDGHIKDGSHIMRCTDHWNRYKDDIKIMKELNNDTYCTSIEWSRIEPEQGKYDMEVVKHYRDEISLLLESGIKPLLALYHLSNPQWFEDIGGWCNPEAVEIFSRFARFAVENFGDLVSDWITINDPCLTLIFQYLWALIPPGKRDFGLFMKAMHHMVLTHINCYKEIHRIRTEKNFPGETIVGVAMHIRAFEPLNGNILNKLATRIAKHFLWDMILTAMATGKFVFNLGFGGYPAGKGKFYDFIGINYWTRNVIRFKPDIKSLFHELKVKENTDTTDAGWEIYPEGIYKVCKEYFQKYKAPIFIIQNGLRESIEKKRPKAIYENLRHVSRLIREGIPVKRYYIWALTDIFECHEGESAKLGIVENDFETQTRTIRKSGYLYGEICKNKAATREIIKKYLE